jgi:hypothetical protein
MLNTSNVEFKFIFTLFNVNLIYNSRVTLYLSQANRTTPQACENIPVSSLEHLEAQWSTHFTPSSPTFPKPSPSSLIASTPIWKYVFA